MKKLDPTWMQIHDVTDTETHNDVWYENKASPVIRGSEGGGYCNFLGDNAFNK